MENIDNKCISRIEQILNEEDNFVLSLLSMRWMMWDKIDIKYLRGM